MDKDVIHDIFFKISKQVVISTVIVGLPSIVMVR